MMRIGIEKERPMLERRRGPQATGRAASQEIISVCDRCRKIQDTKTDEWTSVYHVEERENQMVTHGICPECSKKVTAGMEGVT